MLTTKNYKLYLNSLTIFSHTLLIKLLKYFFYKTSYYFNIKHFYDTIISFLTTLKNNKFCILLVNKEFDAYEFKKYLITKLHFIKKSLYIKKFLKTKIFKKTNNIFLFLTKTKLFLNVHKKSNKILRKLNKHKNSKLNLILFSRDNLNLIHKNITTKNFFSNLLVDFKRNTYIQSVIYNLHNLKLNIYNSPDIQTNLYSNIFNQDEIIEAILTNLNSLKFIEKTNKPIGSWLLCGPSGTGKTEIAKVLTYSLFNSINKLIKIDMSEYSEKYSVSKLIGAAPGYLGYGQDTVISAKFNTGSSFVVLFDELEKADKSIINIMLQLLDEGRLTLSTGRVLDFTKSFIIFTSNAGYTNNLNIKKISTGEILSTIHNEFPMEFLNRLNKIVVFNPITKTNYAHIFNKFILENSLKLNFYIRFHAFVKTDLIKIYCNELYGSRPLKRFNNSIFNLLDLLNTHLTYNSYYNLNYINNCKTLRTNIVL